MIDWRTYATNSYQWDILTPQGFSWNPFHGAVPQGINSFANIVFNGMAYLMHLILQLLGFALDPSAFISAVMTALTGVIQGAYTSVFEQILPAGIAIASIFVLYRFIRAHHAKLIQIIGMLILVCGFATFFYFNTSKFIGSLSKFDDTMANYALELASGSKSTDVNDSLSIIWDDYILNEWELGEFGNMSPNLSDFAVTTDEVKAWLTYETGEAMQGKPVQFTLRPGDNWVTLLLSRAPADDTRYALYGLLVNPSVARGAAYQNATTILPTDRIILALAQWLPALPVLAFIAVISFLLFAYSFGFLVGCISLIVAIPLGLIPDYGWNLLFKTLSKTGGMLIGKVLNALYLGIVFLIVNIVSIALFSIGLGPLAMWVNGFVFVLAFIYRGWFMRTIGSKLPEKYRPPKMDKSWQRIKQETSSGLRPITRMAERFSSHSKDEESRGKQGSRNMHGIEERMQSGKREHVSSSDDNQDDSRGRTGRFEEKFAEGNEPTSSKNGSSKEKLAQPESNREHDAVRARRRFGKPGEQGLYRTKTGSGAMQSRIKELRKERETSSNLKRTSSISNRRETPNQQARYNQGSGRKDGSQPVGTTQSVSHGSGGKNTSTVSSSEKMQQTSSNPNRSNHFGQRRSGGRSANDGRNRPNHIRVDSPTRFNRVGEGQERPQGQQAQRARTDPQFYQLERNRRPQADSVSKEVQSAPKKPKRFQRSQAYHLVGLRERRNEEVVERKNNLSTKGTVQSSPLHTQKVTPPTF
jgi:hypothetical protein